MNLGQAVAVCLFEFIRDGGVEVARPVFESPQGVDAENITAMLREILEKTGYTNKVTAVSTNEKVRRWVRRLRIGRRDAPLVMGALRQILWKIGRLE